MHLFSLLIVYFGSLSPTYGDNTRLSLHSVKHPSTLCSLLHPPANLHISCFFNLQKRKLLLSCISSIHKHLWLPGLCFFHHRHVQWRSDGSDLEASTFFFLFFLQGSPLTPPELLCHLFSRTRSDDELRRPEMNRSHIINLMLYYISQLRVHNKVRLHS